MWGECGAQSLHSTSAHAMALRERGAAMRQALLDGRLASAFSSWAWQATTTCSTAAGLLLQQSPGLAALAAAQQQPDAAAQPSCSYTTSAAPHAACSNATAPNVPHQRVPYSQRSGTPRPSPWPVFERIDTTKATGAIKWHRSLYRFPAEVQVSLSGRDLVLTGRAGTIRLDLRQLDPSGLVAFKMITLGDSTPSTPSSPGKAEQPAASSSESTAAAAGGGPRHLMAVATPDKERFSAFVAELDASVRGVSVGYLVGVTVKGVGYRMEPMEETPRKSSWYFEDDKGEASATVFPHPKPVPAVRLKVGYSRTAVFPFPPSVRAFCIKPTLLYLYGLRKEEVDGVAAALRSVRKPNVYTGNGIQRVDEVVRIKQRKASK